MHIVLDIQMLLAFPLVASAKLFGLQRTPLVANLCKSIAEEATSDQKEQIPFVTTVVKTTTTCTLLCLFVY